MGNRAFLFDDLVQLPRLSAADTVALITQIETACGAAREGKGKKLEIPQSVLAALGRALRARDELRAAMQSRGDTGAPPDRRRTDMAVDNAWGALEAFLGAHCRHQDSEKPTADEIQAVHDRIFPASEGLTFLLAPYKREWVACQDRLDIMAKEKLEAFIDKLGGARFLRNIHRLHVEYGKVLGITAPEAVETPAIDQRPLIQAAQASLREYVVKARAFADPDVAGSEDLVERLLQPLTSWISKPAAAAQEGGADPAPPASTPAP